MFTFRNTRSKQVDKYRDSDIIVSCVYNKRVQTCFRLPDVILLNKWFSPLILFRISDS